MQTLKIHRNIPSLRLSPLIALIFVASQIYGEPTAPAHNSSHLTSGKGYLAFVRANNIWLYNIANHRQFQIVANGDLPCWIQNKSALAFTRNSNLFLYSFPSGKLRQLTHYSHTSGEQQQITGISWDSIGNGLAFSVSSTATVRVKNTMHSADIPVSVINYLSLESHHVSEVMGPAETGTTFAFSDQSSPSFSQDGKCMLFSRNGDIWFAQRGDKYDGTGWNRWQWEISRLLAPADFDDPNWHGSRDNEGVIDLAFDRDDHQIAFIKSRLNGTGISEMHIITLKKGAISNNQDFSALKIKSSSTCLDNACTVTWSKKPDILYYGTNIQGYNIYRYNLQTDTSTLILKDASNPCD